MALEVKCWFVLGYGIPHGITPYVLIKEKNTYEKDSYYIYDVETGFKYSIQDNFSPLQKVFCIVNSENVSYFIVYSYISDIGLYVFYLGMG